MNITGINAEYNPFHNGHLYQLEAARKMTNADYVIVVMNGDFMQRGLPAFWNKYSRAAMALANGADAVLELPVLYGTASAEYFARGSVQLLHELGAVTHLSFGCECVEPELLHTLTTFLLTEPSDYRQDLNRYLSQGLSFPKARMQAILDYFYHSSKQCPLPVPEATLTAILSQPNTILAIEYLKALQRLHSTIKPVPCKRMDQGYHQETISCELASATAIRTEYIRYGCTPALKQALPPYSYNLLHTELETRSPITMDDFYPFLQYALWQSNTSLTDYLDISEELANRIQAVYRPEFSYQELVDSICHKQFTRTRVQRSLLHLLLNIRTDDMSGQLASGSMHYARLLGFRKEASPLLRHLASASTIPIIQRVAEGSRILSKESQPFADRLFKLDLAAAHLYEQVVTNRYHVPGIHEYTHGIIIHS